MSQRTTDVQIFDELAQEAGEISKDLESGRIVDPELIALGVAKLTTIMRQPPEAYRKEGPCLLTEIDESVSGELFKHKEWDHTIRRDFFNKQIATIQSMNGEGSRNPDALIELDRFLRMVIVGIETYRAHALRR